MSARRDGSWVHYSLTDLAESSLGEALAAARADRALARRCQALRTCLTPELAKGALLLVTMGCGDECPFIPGAVVDDWPLDDPRGKDAGAVRAIRDEIRSRVERLVASRNWGSVSS